ncbi:hypothetical protein FACS189452_10580 [Bacteroidia bacterium]|nr:hypothetical protein FACS189452_10580 [Bacteroidia bacterium]GHT81853.1 hypothetical protein FACS189467_6540 [Bacteroidia bacterium]
MQKKLFLGIVPLLLTLVQACNSAVVYETYKNIPGIGWSKDSIATFEVNITDTLALHNIYIDLRNNTAYPYCNLFLFIKTISPTQHFVCDTVEYMLTDSYGRWFGKGFSHIIDNRLEYKKYVQFPTSGTYRFEIQQGMRMYFLLEVVNVGLRIERADKNNYQL